MPDKKISQLTGGGAAAASDKFVVARGGANFSIEGTAVAAAATSVGTLTSLAVSGNLTVDTNTLFVDATNNRVGVGTASPSYIFDVAGASNATAIATSFAYGATGELYTAFRFHNTSFSGGSSEIRNIVNGSSSLGSGLAFFTSQNVTGTLTERGRFDNAGNLGIGTASPATRLDVNGATTLRGNVTFVADATYDIGASGANRPRNIYTSADATIAGVRVGLGAGAINTNTAVGNSALNANSTGANNTAVGLNALYNNTTGQSNTANGAYSLYSILAGASYNTATGQNALYSNVASSNNTAAGQAALYSTTGGSNTAVGQASLYLNNTGSNNTAVGKSAGYGDGTQANTTGTNNTFLGYEAMGASATASNVITLGNASIATLRCQVTTITSLSDARDKTDIAPIPAGLDFVNALNPVSFVWNMRDGGKVGVPEFGFIAQELQAAQAEQGVTVPNLVSTSNPDKLEASAGTLIPILTKAIQELAAQNAALTARIAALEAK